MIKYLGSVGTFIRLLEFWREQLGY